MIHAPTLLADLKKLVGRLEDDLRWVFEQATRLLNCLGETNRTVVPLGSGPLSQYFQDFHRPRTLGDKSLSSSGEATEMMAITEQSNPDLYQELRSYKLRVELQESVPPDVNHIGFPPEPGEGDPRRSHGALVL